MKKLSLLPLFFVSAILLLMVSCKKEDSGLKLSLSAPVDISSFKVGTANGIIDSSKGTISISLPFGTDFTKLSPAITLPDGASVTPAPGEVVNLKNPVLYRVINGNLYKDFTVTATETPAILSFKGNNNLGVIEEATRSIKVIVPSGSNMTRVAVDITMAAGATILPASGSLVDFTNPVIFKVTTATATVNYIVTAIDASADKPVAFLGVYPTKNDISNPDELAAANWFFANYNKAQYVSLDAVKNNTIDLTKFSIIWWHEDATQTLPDIAYNDVVVNAMKAYRAAGGNLLLSTFAARWIDAIGIVPAFKGPNNVFGDAIGGQRQDGTNNWGISINPDHLNHPLFAGLPLTPEKSYPVVYLLDKQAFRLNHVAWWKVNEWGNYGDAAGWRSQTGGVDLAGPDGSNNTNSNITIAEFKKAAANGATIVFTPGSYDWYAEPNPSNNTPSPANSYLTNIQQLTKNAIEYLRKQ